MRDIHHRFVCSNVFLAPVPYAFFDKRRQFGWDVLARGTKEALMTEICGFEENELIDLLSRNAFDMIRDTISL